MSEQQIQERLKIAFDFNDNRVICLNTKKVFNNCIEASAWAGVASCNISQASIGKVDHAGVDKNTEEKLCWMKYKEYIKIFGEC